MMHRHNLLKRISVFAAVALASLAPFTGVAYASAFSVAIVPETGAISEFADLQIHFPSAWARASARLAERLNIGYAGRMEPYTRKLTREELAYVSVKLYEVLSKTELSPSLSSMDKVEISARFTDSSKGGKSFTDEVFLAIKNELMYGVSQTEFSTGTLVTREQTAAVLYRIAERFTDTSSSARADLSVFKDGDEISEYAFDCFSVMVGAGILSGVSENTLAPKNVCTYEEVLAIATRFLESLSEPLNIELYSSELSGVMPGSPSVLNVHTTELEYQGKQTEILDAEWAAVSGAVGYAVDCHKDDGTVLRSTTTETGITIFESNAYSEISVFAVSKNKKAGIIGDIGSSLLNPVIETFAEYNEIYEYNDYSSLLSVEEENEILLSNYATGNFTNPKDISIKSYQSSGDASSDMESITVRIWKMGANDTRVSGTVTLSVHTAVAQDVIEIFEDIYNGPEQFPIYAVGGYSWRGAGSKSSHNNGLAIDINPDHNYFINTKGGILAGKMWNPQLSPYSIKPDGDVVRAFDKKGWYWGGIGWSTTGKDYMHFSYTGV